MDANQTPVITDAELDAWEVGFNRTDQRVAPYLRPFSPEMRYAIVREGRTYANVTPGWRTSDAIILACKNVPEGRTPGGDSAATLMAYDPTGHKAARAGSWGSFVADANR